MRVVAGCCAVRRASRAADNPVGVWKELDVRAAALVVAVHHVAAGIVMQKLAVEDLFAGIDAEECGRAARACAASRRTAAGSAPDFAIRSWFRYKSRSTLAEIRLPAPNFACSARSTALTTSFGGIRPGHLAHLFRTRHGRHAVVGGQHDQDVIHSHSLVQELKKMIQQSVGDGADFVLLRRVGPVAVADVVVRRVADSQQVRRIVLAEALALDGAFGEQFLQLV